MTMTEAANKKSANAIIGILPWICLGLILILHFLLLLNLFAPAIATPDANGYWAQGSLLFTSGHTWFEPESDVQYIGIHWLVTGSGRYYSRYPPGLPVLVGLVYTLLGFKASVLVNPVLAMLSLVGLYLLFRRLLGPWWGLAGVLVLAINPVFNQQALWCFAHMAVTFCLVWGLFFLVRWSEQGQLWEIFLAGLIFGCIPTIRYPEALFLLGVAVFLLWHLHSRERIWPHYVVAIVGVALPLVPLLIRNQVAFGAFYRTVYTLSHEQTAFSWQYFENHLVDYVRALNGEGVGFFFPLGVIGLTMMCYVRRWRRVGVLLVMLTVPLTLLYIAYYFNVSLRFLLPTFICYIFAGLWLLARLTDRASLLLKFSMLAIVLLLQLACGGFNGLVELKQLHYQKEALVRLTDALEQDIEHDDVIIADSDILQHLDFVRHWRLVDAMYLQPIQQFKRLMQPKANPDAPMPQPVPRDPNPNVPTPMQVEKQKLRAEKFRGLTPQEREHKIAQDILAWAGQHKVYYVGTQSELDRLRGTIFNQSSFRVIARVPLPESPPLPEPRGMPAVQQHPGNGALSSRELLQGNQELVITEFLVQVQ